ncbi:hypothetical protein C0993_003387 [Termitomyces sp. T159_Od127]|nr:hypothetical protein C0993_003387 [Termitomyces sp. T159_Od127]
MKRKCSGQGEYAEKNYAQPKRQRSSAQQKQSLPWPEYFQDVAILPDLIKFSYIPRNELRVTEDSLKGRRKKSPDYSESIGTSTTTVALEDEDDHVLVLEFVDNAKGKKTTGNSIVVVPALQPAGVKKLVEKRNERFQEAVSEFLLSPSGLVDPVNALKAAARAHIPVNPSGDQSEFSAKKFMDIPNFHDRPLIDDIITELKEQTKEALTAILEPPLSPSITQAFLNFRRITTLYSHQVAAIHALAQNKHVIVSTSTASGKSVIYQVPVLRFLEADPSATAIFVYPTKALAQDQKAAMEQLLYACPGLQYLKVATYDGDTPQELRSEVRETSSIIFTNFDMIHASILPHEDLWRRVHMSKIFGLTSEEIEAITKDGAPSGSKDFLVWNPPPIDERVPSLGRHSSITEATGLMRFLMKRGIRVILFCKIRKVCELAMRTLRADLSSEGRLDILERTMPYRGGYSREDRRQIEQDAFNGRLLGIVATNALELGVDIGALDAVIMLGFPMTIASFRQQAGRAGRRLKDSLAVLVADSYPIDQYYVTHPEELYEKPIDELVIDFDNKPLLEAHLQCAAQEMPLSHEDEKYFGVLFKEVCETQLVKDDDGWYHTNPKFLPFPSKFISIRGVQEETYAVINITKVEQSGGRSSLLEEVEVSRAIFEIYEGGVFMHQGLAFIVREVSHDSKIAHVTRADVNWITSPRDFTNVDAVQTYRIKEIKGSFYRVYYGKVAVEVKVFGFFKIRNKVILEAVDLETPAWQRETTGVWIDVPKALLELFLLKGINPAEAIHAAQHAILNQFSLAQDLKTECKAAEKEYKLAESKRKRPARYNLRILVDKLDNNRIQIDILRRY